MELQPRSSRRACDEHDGSQAPVPQLSLLDTVGRRQHARRQKPLRGTPHRALTSVAPHWRFPTWAHINLGMVRCMALSLASPL